MSRYVPSRELAERVAVGDVAAIARLISRAEQRLPEAQEALAAIYRRAGNAHVIGITGVAGSGKSTLVAILARRLKERGKKVGIVAIDPSSPYSGGAILGDRIRMSEVASDTGIYVRSMASRGAMGGLARAALEAVDILDCGGYATIIIETVGAGQDEVDIARASHTTIVLTPPGLGDEVQALKAGMLEVADIHVVSKSDRPGSDRTLADLKHMLGLAMHADREWRPPVLAVSATGPAGFEDLLAAIDRHRSTIAATARGIERSIAIAGFRLRKTAESLLLERFAHAVVVNLPALAERARTREADPQALAAELISASNMGLRS